VNLNCKPGSTPEKIELKIDIILSLVISSHSHNNCENHLLTKNNHTVLAERLSPNVGLQGTGRMGT
jgi:hypothetical protein